MRFEQRVVLITGGGQGIGRVLSESFAREGAVVYIADIDREAGSEWEAHLKSLGFPVHYIPTDIADPNQVKDLLAQIGADRGKLDVLCNNAGIMISKPIDQLDIAEWDRVIHVNLRGAFLCAKYAVPWMRKAGGGAIVNIASTRALMSEPHTEAYSASKGGILALTHALAVSLGPDHIRVNAVSPGWIDTTPWQKSSARQPATLTPEDHAQHPVGRVGIPEDVAKAVLFLASRDAEFITGTNLVVDGGMTIKMIYV
ncbi:MAG: SDR family oxidoreductase [Alicyclobacillaceae bacterium]|nr:SDR family oxidoreductase [Alicyclobacillaceae bacterium]